MKVKYGRWSIRQKLIFVFLCSACFVILVNLMIQWNLNQVLGKMDQVYISNVSLNDLHSGLQNMQGSMTEYLNTKSSDSLEAYFQAEGDYKKLIEGLNDQIVANNSKMLEKNIRSLSETYLEITQKAVEAKRGRNIEKYKEYYEQATAIYAYMESCIYSLNNDQLKSNLERYDVMSATMRYSQVWNTVILAVMAAVNILVVVLITRQITAPLATLSRVAFEVAEGNFQVELPPVENQDEVGAVTRAFRKMVQNIRVYIDELKNSMEVQSEMREKELLMEAHLKEAKLKYLQTQINPHFLFNTLNAGAQLAMLEDAQRTYDYVQNVAQFFRYNLKDLDGDVSLSEEIELIDHYIYILNVRFAGEIHFQKKVREDCGNIRIPPMILQPIVENSVNHGIRNVEWEKKIDLEVNRMEDLVCICIRDNGVGIKPEKIKEIMEGKPGSPSADGDSNGVGMQNVIIRLRMYYGRDDIMEIIGLGENVGTEVLLYLPAGQMTDAG